MCIIVHKPEGVVLDEIVYKNCFARNSHGAGFAYALDGKLNVEKGFMDADSFIKSVKAVEEYELLIHCRLMSKGKIGKDNCHPFYLESAQFPNYSFAIVHNGTLNWRSTDDKSDTSFFVDDAIKPTIDRDPYFFEQSLSRAMMGAFIGSDNKLGVMSYNKEKDEFHVGIVNKTKGIEYNGCWFSNLSFSDDFSRYIAEIDHSRMKNWTPKLWKDPLLDNKFNSYHHGQELIEYDHGSNGHGKSPSPIKPTGDCVWHPGYGWYFPDPKYVGSRSLADFNKWLASNGKSSAPSETDVIDLPKGLDLDPMNYLTHKEQKIARKECVNMLSSSYPDFDFKGISTIEIAAWARSELRALFEEFNDITNHSLMRMIISGKFD